VTASEDAQLCMTSRRTIALQDPGPRCGGGIPQPTWPACHAAATYAIHGYGHLYCTTHTATRLRALDTAAQMQREAEARRAEFAHQIVRGELPRHSLAARYTRALRA
jgi:hypothetical protein